MGSLAYVELAADKPLELRAGLERLGFHPIPRGRGAAVGFHDAQLHFVNDGQQRLAGRPFLGIEQPRVNPPEEMHLKAFAADAGLNGLTWRRPDPALAGQHPGGVLSLHQIVLAHSNPPGLDVAARHVFGPAAVNAAPNGVEIRCGAAKLLFLNEDGMRRRFPGLKGIPKAPALVAFSFKVRDLGKLFKHMRDRAVRTLPLPGDRLVVDGQLPNGIIAEFVAI